MAAQPGAASAEEFLPLFSFITAIIQIQLERIRFAEHGTWSPSPTLAFILIGINILLLSDTIHQCPHLHLVVSARCFIYRRQIRSAIPQSFTTGVVGGKLDKLTLFAVWTDVGAACERKL